MAVCNLVAALCNLVAALCNAKLSDGPEKTKKRISLDNLS